MVEAGDLERNVEPGHIYEMLVKAWEGLEADPKPEILDVYAMSL